jgi:hypothetical protein
MDSPIKGSWKVGYTTLKDLDRGHVKSYDCVLHFKDVKMISLMDARGIMVAVRPMHDGDLLKPGYVLDFKYHQLKIDVSLISPPEVCDPTPDIEPLVISPSMSVSGYGSGFLPRFLFQIGCETQVWLDLHPL